MISKVCCLIISKPIESVLLFEDTKTKKSTVWKAFETTLSQSSYYNKQEFLREIYINIIDSLLVEGPGCIYFVDANIETNTLWVCFVTNQTSFYYRSDKSIDFKLYSFVYAKNKLKKNIETASYFSLYNSLDDLLAITTNNSYIEM